MSPDERDVALARNARRLPPELQERLAGPLGPNANQSHFLNRGARGLLTQDEAHKGSWGDRLVSGATGAIGGFATGGPAGAFAGGAAGAIRNPMGKPGSGLGGLVESGATGAAAGGVTRLLKGGKPGMTDKERRAGMTPDELAADSAQVAAQRAGGGGSLLSRAGDWIMDNPDKALGLGLAGANVISGASQAGRAGSMRDQALASLQEPEREDLSGMYGNPSNPYATKKPNKARQAALASLGGF